MSYVMIPVPEDRVEDVMQYVVRLMTQASMQEWDESSIAQLFGDIDEPSRALLSTVATATLNDERITTEEAASRVELSWRESMGLLREINDIAREESRPPLLIRRAVSETLPNGRTRDIRVFSMNDDVAKLVYAADRAHLLGEEHPISAETDE